MKDIASIDELIQNRRSIYPNMYSSEAVDDAIIHQMLENANFAPTHKLTEPWRFVVFKGDGIKKFANYQAERYKQTHTDDFDQIKYEKLLNKPLKCSHIIAIGMKRHPVVPEMEEIASVAAAVQNMWLTASANKIGCYWSTGGVTFDEEAKPFFGLGEADKLMGFLYIGSYEGDKWPQARRQPVEEKVTWVTGE